MEYILKGGTVVTHIEKKKVDLHLADGKIIALGEDLNVDGAEVIDCTGKFILPGLIDAHVHFRDPGYPEKEDFASGSRAAARGGVTTVFDMPNTNPPTISPEFVEEKINLASAKSLVNFGIFAGATPENAKLLTEVKDRVMGIKIYMGSSTGNLLVNEEDQLREFFELGMQIVVHAENELKIKERTLEFQDIQDPQIHSVIRSNDVAAIATQRAIRLGIEYGTKLHIAHMSTKEELLLVRAAHHEGYKNLSCEVTPHHLFLNVEMYEKMGNYLRVNPPVRSVEDVRALWEDGIGLKIVDMVATDHAPHLRESKEQGYWQAPSGMPGVQEMLLLLLSKVQSQDLTLERLVELTSYNPARVFAMKNKGQIKVGFDADLVIVDMDKKDVLSVDKLESRCGWSNYVDREFAAWPITTFVGGNLVWDGKNFFDQHKGQLVTRNDI